MLVGTELIIFSFCFDFVNRYESDTYSAIGFILNHYLPLFFTNNFGVFWLKPNSGEYRILHEATAYPVDRIDFTWKPPQENKIDRNIIS